jgi:hypothetical protein
MWKVIALIVAVILSSSSTSVAVEIVPAKATPEVRQKQMEELGAIRGRIVFKLEELRKLLSQTALQARNNAVSDSYTKTKAVISGRINAENAKAMKDQPTLDSLAAKTLAMDTALNKTQRAWAVYQNALNDHSEVINYLGSLLQLCTFDDYWNRTDMDVQLLVNVATAVESKADKIKIKLTDAIAQISSAFDEAEPVMKE